MKIQGGNNGPIRPERAPDARERENVRREEKKNTIGQPERPRDRVDISPEAREKLEKRLENLLDRLRERRGARIQPEPRREAHIQPIEGEPRNSDPVGQEPAHIQPIRQPEPPHIQPVQPEPPTIQPIEGGNAQPVDGGFSTDPIGARHRLQQVRDKILSGAYDLDHVLAVVARRILDRGDV